MTQDPKHLHIVKVLRINGELYTFNKALTVSEVLNEINIEKSFVAIAVNRNCVPRSLWETHALNNGDAIEVLTPMSGG